MSNEIMNAIRNAIESAVNDNNVNLYDDSINDITSYIFGLFNTEVIPYYHTYKRYSNDFAYMHRLFTLAIESSFEDIKWFTESSIFNRMICKIIDIIGC